MDKIIKNCGSCYFRHSCLRDLPIRYEQCKHWKLGKCYTCKYKDAPDEEWFKRGCESECFGGCKKYKRDWKKTWELFKHRLR